MRSFTEASRTLNERIWGGSINKHSSKNKNSVLQAHVGVAQKKHQVYL